MEIEETLDMDCGEDWSRQSGDGQGASLRLQFNVHDMGSNSEQVVRGSPIQLEVSGVDSTKQRRDYLSWRKPFDSSASNLRTLHLCL